MISYLDRQFCSQKCANSECSRNFNDDVLARAKAWWRGDNPPIDFADLKTDKCGFVDKDKK